MTWYSYHVWGTSIQGSSINQWVVAGDKDEAFKKFSSYYPGSTALRVNGKHKI